MCFQVLAEARGCSDCRLCHSSSLQTNHAFTSLGFSCLLLVLLSCWICLVGVVVSGFNGALHFLLRVVCGGGGGGQAIPPGSPCVVFSLALQWYNLLGGAGPSTGRGRIFTTPPGIQFRTYCLQTLQHFW